MKSAAAVVTLTLAVVGAPAAKALVINDYFDATIALDPNAAQIQQAILETTGRIASLYSNPVTVGIYFQQQPGFYLGASQSNYYFVPVGDYTAASQAVLASHPSDVVLAEALAHLGTGAGADPTTNILTTSANLRALGFDAPGGFEPDGSYSGTGSLDGVISLSTINPLDYDPAIPPFSFADVEFNARNTIAHEVDEILGGGGAGSVLNFIDDIQNGGTVFDPATDLLVLGSVGPLDRFRYSAPGVPSFTTDPNATPYFSLDGGATAIVGFNGLAVGDHGDFGPSNCGDFGASIGGDHVQDAFACANAATIPLTRGRPEDVMLQSIGWTATPEPQTWVMMTFGLAVIGGLARRRKANQGARQRDRAELTRHSIHLNCALRRTIPRRHRLLNN